MNARRKEKALLVTDACGQVIDRIGQSWSDLAPVDFVVARSAETSVADACRLASDAGLVHWLDFRRFCQAAKAVDVPQVATVHHVVESERPKAMKCLEVADAIVTTSRRWQSRLRQQTGREATLIPYTLDTRAFPFRPPRDTSKGIPWTLGFVGKGRANLDDRKGTALLLQILETLRADPFEFEFLIIGPGWDVLAKQISALGIHVHRAQFETTEETAEAYARMDALIVTASEEGGPVTILEAMSCGVPVITSNVGHVPEVIRDGETGFVCGTRIVSEYVNALQALRMNPKLVAQVTREARAFVEQNRDNAIVIPQIDFAGVFAEARSHFATLPPAERTKRRARQKVARLRQAAARMLRPK